MPRLLIANGWMPTTFLKCIKQKKNDLLSAASRSRADETMPKTIITCSSINARTCKAEVAVDFVVTFASFKLDDQTQHTHQNSEAIQNYGRQIPKVNGAVFLDLAFGCHFRHKLYQSLT